MSDTKQWAITVGFVVNQDTEADAIQEAYDLVSVLDLPHGGFTLDAEPNIADDSGER